MTADEPERPLESAPEAVLERVASCVRFVSGSLEFELDFTRETLGVLDHYVEQARESLQGRPEAAPLVAEAVGAYLGEVIRRIHHCWWCLDDPDPARWRLDFAHALLSFYPVQAVYAALGRAGDDDEARAGDDDDEGDPGFGLRDDDRAVVWARLAELPAVSEQEYYAPSTRLEVIDIALDALMGRALADPDGPRTYGPADYA